MAWNGLSFTVAAELAGPLRSGAAIGIQQTVLAASASPRRCVRGNGRVGHRGRSRSRSRRCSRSPAGGCCGRSRERRHRLRRDAAPRAARRALRDRRRARREPAASAAPPRTRRTSSPRRGCARPGSRSRSTRTGTWSGSCRRRGAGGLGRLAPRHACRRAAASTERSASSRRSRPSSASGRGTVVVFRGEEGGCVGSRALVARGDALAGAFSSSTTSRARCSARAERRSASSPASSATSAASCLEGRAGHAGTTPMDGRAGRARRGGRGDPADPGRGPLDRGAVATVGQLEVEPGGSTSSRVGCGSPSTRARPTPSGSTRWSPRSGSSRAMRTEPVAMARGAPSAARASSSARGLPVVELPSGAGHDAGILAAAGVPTRDALRPQPERRRQPFARRALRRTEDVALAVDVLADALARSRARLASLYALAEDDLLRAFPEHPATELAQVLVPLDDRREVVPRERAGLARERDVAVREQELGLADAARVEDRARRGSGSTSRSRGRGRGRGRRSGSSRPRPTSGRG